MPYVKRPTYSLLKVASGGAWTGAFDVIMTTTPTSFNNGTLTTPDYHGKVGLALLDMTCHTLYDNSGSQNWLDTTTAYFGLKEGSSATVNAGYLPDYSFVCPANSFIFSEYKVKGLNNIASYIKPNTTYTCRMIDCFSKGNSLFLWNNYYELSLYFNL